MGRVGAMSGEQGSTRLNFRSRRLPKVKGGQATPGRKGGEADSALWLGMSEAARHEGGYNDKNIGC